MTLKNNICNVRDNVLNSKPQSNKRQQEKLKQRSLLQVLKKVHATPQGVTLRRLHVRSRQAREQAERERDLGHMPLLGPQVKCVWVPGLRLDWSIQTKRNVVLVVSCRVLSKWCIMRRPGRWGRLLITRAIGKVI